ncbi:hypothetical protein [Methylobacterium sp. Gmos1]
MPVERTFWQVQATARDLSCDRVQVDPVVLRRGLLSDEDQARSVTSALLAGTPAEEPLHVVWEHDAVDDVIMMVASSHHDTEDIVEVERRFSQREDGAWDVNHALFALPSRYQRSGGARRMLRASLDAYDRLGVVRIDVYANLTVGGYAWARLGFAANDAQQVRAALSAALADVPRSPLFRAAQSTAEISTDDDLMYNLACLIAPDGTSYGRRLLARAGWHGHLDLTNPRHRERLARNLDE